MKTISRKPILLLVVVLLAVTTFVLVKRHGRASEGPDYGGRSLSVWLSHIDQPVLGRPDRNAPLFLQTSNAIVQIGTNGLTFLIEWIRYKPSRAKHTFWELLPRLPSGDVFHSIGNWSVRDFRRAEATVVAFAILGESAAVCVPELLLMARDPSNPEAAERAIYAMPALGPAAFPALLEIASNTNAPTRREAIYGLGKMGANAVSAIPMLIQTLDDPDQRSVHAAVVTLGRLGLHPEMVIPALTKTLQRPNSDLRYAAALSLGDFGTNAAPAVPALRLALADQHPYVRQAASNALQVITSRSAVETAESVPR